MCVNQVTSSRMTLTDNAARGNLAWSTHSNTLLVWNLSDGVDVYHIQHHGQPVWVKKLGMDVKRNMVVQVAFGNEGKLAMSGSDRGEVWIWDLGAETSQDAQVLVHSKGELCEQYWVYPSSHMCCRSSCHPISWSTPCYPCLW